MPDFLNKLNKEDQNIVRPICVADLCTEHNKTERKI
jgi:hypothetical protein